MNKNKKIVVSLKGEIENGEIFEQTPEGQPLLIELGQSPIFPEMEKVLEDMKPGETKSVLLAPEDGYGPHHQELVHQINSSNFNADIQPSPGMILSLNVEKEGKQEQIPATVVAVDNDVITVDYNHPLAGKTVIYTMTLHEVRE